MKKLIAFLLFVPFLLISGVQAQSINRISDRPAHIFSQQGRYVNGFACMRVVPPRHHGHPRIHPHWRMKAIRHGRYS